MISLPEAAEWIDMERRCCPFLTLEMEVSGLQSDWWLRLSGPSGVKPLLAAELVLQKESQLIMWVWSASYVEVSYPPVSKLSRSLAARQRLHNLSHGDFAVTLLVRVGRPR